MGKRKREDGRRKEKREIGGERFVYVRKKCNGKSLGCGRGNYTLEGSSFVSIPCP